MSQMWVECGYCCTLQAGDNQYQMSVLNRGECDGYWPTDDEQHRLDEIDKRLQMLLPADDFQRIASVTPASETSTCQVSYCWLDSCQPAKLKNLSSPIDMHTHTSSTFDDHMTWTFWPQDQCRVTAIYCMSIKLGVDSSSHLKCWHTQSWMPLVTVPTHRLPLAWVTAPQLWIKKKRDRVQWRCGINYHDMWCRHRIATWNWFINAEITSELALGQKGWSIWWLHLCRHGCMMCRQGVTHRRTDTTPRLFYLLLWTWPE